MDEQSAPRILEALWRYRASSLLIVLAVMAVSFGVALLTSDASTARTRIVLKSPEEVTAAGVETTSESTFVRYVKQRALFLTSDRVLQRARKQLGGPESLTELREGVTAEASEQGESIGLEVSAGSFERAATIANAITEAYREESLAESKASGDSALRTLDRQRREIMNSIEQQELNGGGDTANTAATDTLSELSKLASQIQVANSRFGDGVSFVDNAATDESNPLGGVLRDVAIGFVLGALIAGALAWLRADRDRRVRQADDVREVVDEPLLGEIETLQESQVMSLNLLSTPPLRSYQFVASGLRAMVERGVVVVTGTSEGQGSTTTTLQIASAAARDGLRVLIVDAAVRSNTLSRTLGMADISVGLATIATQQTPLDKCIRTVPLGGNVQLWAIPMGHYTAQTLDHFRTTLLEEAIGELKWSYDLVLVDAAPPSIAPETTSIIQQSDGVVVTVRRDCRVRALRRLREQLQLFGGTIAGYVFTFATSSRGSARVDAESTMTRQQV
ncbi:MAG: AAA family ATPase [Pseudonocardiaceae bacterium]|nr:AAA family ATPase [Pseudonocardiaceae bacterium]